MTRGRTIRDPDAIRRAERDRPGATASAADSSSTEILLDLQRSAGNQAVGQALVQGRANQAAPSAQRAPAGPAAAQGRGSAPAAPAPAPTASLQLGAMWQDLVVRSLARARERLEHHPVEADAALQDIDTALAGIASVKNATPTEDDNHARLEVLERRVRSFRGLVAGVAGKGKDDHAIERDMIVWRAEAVALGKEFNEPSGDIYPNTDPADWKAIVVDHLWGGQQAFSQGDVEAAVSAFRRAQLNILRFRRWVPGYHYFELMRLEAGIEGTTRLMESRTDDTRPLTEAAIDAYETAEYVGRYLTGRPVDDDDGGHAGDADGANEPDFTWERTEEDTEDDTALERP